MRTKEEIENKIYEMEEKIRANGMFTTFAIQWAKALKWVLDEQQEAQ